MPRVRIEVDKSELVNAINRVEAIQKFSTRQDLAQAVSDYMNIDVSPSVVLLRIKEFGIEPKTPKGQRGRRKGAKLSKAHKEAMQVGRKSKSITNIAEMKSYCPKDFLPIIEKYETTPTRSLAVKIKCLDCADFNRTEIRNCTVKSCSLWDWRPYK
jgi:hypothetical protein